MSFGCGLGDIIQVTKLIARTINSIRNAPTHLKQAEETVTSLDLIYNSIASEVEKPESVFQRDPGLGERLGVLTGSCESTLNKLCDILDQYQSLGTRNVRILDRVRFPKKEVDDVQRELQYRYQNLSNFLDVVGLGGVGRIENKVDGIVQQQDKLLQAMDRLANLKVETGSVMSAYTNDDKAVWKEWRRDLTSAGFKSSDLERHKPLISRKLLELQQSGMLEWTPGADMDDKQSVRSDRTVTFIGRTRNQYLPPTVETVYEGSDEEGDQTRNRLQPGASDTLFEDSDEDNFLARPGVQTEKNGRISERLPTYKDAMPSPRLTIPVPSLSVPQRGSRSAGNSPRQSFPNFPMNLSGGRPGIQGRPQTSPQYGGSPRQSAEAVPRITRRPSALLDGSAMYDDEIRHGQRSISRIVWRYRRPGDVQRPPMQSADLGDGTLPKAASEGRTSDVHVLVSQGHSVESSGTRAVPESSSFQDTTALFRAASNQHFETAHVLLRYGANANITRKDGKTLLGLLAAGGQTELVRLLLEYGASPAKSITQAAMYGHIAIVQLLLNHGADIDEIDKQTALYRASSKGYSDIVDLLLREGADVSFVANSGPSALYKAVYNGHYRCVRSLLLYGARPEVGCGLNGETALFTACAVGHEPTVRLLLQRKARPNDTWYRPYQPPLHLRDGRVEEFFVDAPIHAASRGGRLSIGRLLVEYGADVNLRTHYGQTPMDIAFEKGYMTLVEHLYAVGGRGSAQAIESAEKRESLDRRRESDARYAKDGRRAQRPSLSDVMVDRDHDDRRSLAVQDPRALQAQDGKRRTKSSSTLRRNEASWRQKGTGPSSKSIGVAAAGALLLDGLMLFT